LENYQDKNSFGWEYSNLGYAILGLHIEKVIQRKYADLLECFLCNHKLNHTKVGYSETALTGNSFEQNPANWRWSPDHVFLPAGGCISTLDDMLSFLLMQMNTHEFELCHKIQVQTDMPFDMGLAWMIEKQTGIVFCMGLTDGFSSFVGFDSKKENGIVILSNYYGPGYGEPNTPNGIGLAYLKTFL
jgi:CubicO group peptidase (beta-lactamase class C family)